MRKTFINTLIKLAKEDDRIFLITPDIGYSVLEPFRDLFPDRYLNVGVAEQNAVSMAAGISMVGFIPYVYTINPFVCMRPFEQIRVDVAYMNTNVRLVGVGAGFSYGAAGATHHSIEDIAIMRALPNMTVLCPGDPWEVEQSVIASQNYKGPIFLRLGKQGEPIINNTTARFQIGKGIQIVKGDSIGIFSTSNTLEMSFHLVEMLKSSGISASLYSMHTIKPLDQNLIVSAAQKYSHIFTIEEHNVIGGLGSAFAEILAELPNKLPRFKRFGIPDEYSHTVGSHSYIRSHYGLSSEALFDKIVAFIRESK